MTKIELAPKISKDFDRILAHLTQYKVTNSEERIAEIIDAISVLARNPFIGRLADGDNRELIIGRRSKGYVALYRYIVKTDVVFVLAIRSQKEAGYV